MKNEIITNDNGKNLPALPHSKASVPSRPSTLVRAHRSKNEKNNNSKFFFFYIPPVHGNKIQINHSLTHYKAMGFYYWSEVLLCAS